MTVKELKKILKDVPDDMIVAVNHSSSCGPAMEVEYAYVEELDPKHGEIYCYVDNKVNEKIIKVLLIQS